MATTLVKTPRLCRRLVSLQKYSCLSHRSASASTFKYEDLQVTLSQNRRPKPDWDKLVFGANFSDHMLEIEWDARQGWGKPVISPIHNLSFHPAAKVFHYSIELFEGMKAFRGEDDKIRLFRPMENMERMNRTMERSGFPTFDGRELVELMKKLIDIDRDWVPHKPPSSLYIRPTCIGTEPSLGVAKSEKAHLYVIVGPVGPYFPTGMKPVSLLADPSFVRAWPGGCGEFKMGSNYGPTIAIGDIAASKGCQQVLWLFGDDHQLTEVGAMNFFTYWINEQGEKELVTAPLNGLILPGVTRKSLLELGIKWGDFKVTERDYTMGEVVKALNENRILEMFGAGTACVVCPVEKILYQENWLNIPTMKNPELTNRFFKALTDIQYGKTHSDWVECVEDQYLEQNRKSQAA